MNTSASLCEGHIFYFYLLYCKRVMVIFTLPFYILSFGKHNMLERSWYIWLIGCGFSWTITVDIALEVKRWEAKTISPYLSLCPINHTHKYCVSVSNCERLYDSWVCGLAEKLLYIDSFLCYDKLQLLQWMRL